MSSVSDHADARPIADARFVSLGTYRRNGELVRTPVWLAGDGDTLVVTTEVSTGKVKRLRHDHRVVLQPCSRFGDIPDDAPTVTGRGELDESAAGIASATGALRAKYGFSFGAFLRVERLVRRLQRRNGRRVILRITTTG